MGLVSSRNQCSSPSNSGRHENEAICDIKGRFTDLIAHVLEMRWNIKFEKGAPRSYGHKQWPVVMKHAEFLKRNQGQGKEEKRDGGLFGQSERKEG